MASEAVLATLRAGWVALEGIDSPKAVIGGLAMSAWNVARYTRDADILVAIDAGQVDGLLRALASAGFRTKHDPALRMIDGQGIIQFLFQPPDALLPFQLDVLLAGSTFQREALDRAVPRSLPGDGMEFRVVRPDDLIVIKLLAGRIIDRADAAMLLRENRAEIDVARLEAAIDGAGLQKDYGEIWQEAFPGEGPLGRQ